MRGHAKLAPVGNYKAGSMTSSIIENCGGSMSNGIFGGRVLCICFFDVVWPLNEITIWSDVFCRFYGQIFCVLVKFTGRKCLSPRWSFINSKSFEFDPARWAPTRHQWKYGAPKNGRKQASNSGKNRYNWSCKPSPRYGWAVTNRLLVS